MDDRVPPRKLQKQMDTSLYLNERDFETALRSLEDSLPEELTGGLPGTSSANWNRDIRSTQGQSPACPTLNNKTTVSLVSNNPLYPTLKLDSPSNTMRSESTLTLSLPLFSATSSTNISSSQQNGNSNSLQDNITRIGLKRQYPRDYRNLFLCGSSQPSVSSAKMKKPLNLSIGNATPILQGTTSSSQSHSDSATSAPTVTFTVGIRQRLDRAKKCLPHSKFTKFLDELKEGVISTRRITPDNSAYPLINTFLNQVTSTALTIPEEIDLTEESTETTEGSLRSSSSSTRPKIHHPDLFLQPIQLETPMNTSVSTQTSVPVIPTLREPSSQDAERNIFPHSSTSNAPHDVPHSEKIRLIRQQMKLIMHAHKCRKFIGVKCGIPHCQLMKDVLEHLSKCPLGKSCTTPHCASSRQIIFHWKNCTKRHCSLCSNFTGLIPKAPLKPPEPSDTSSSNDRNSSKELQEGRTCIVCMEHEITHAIVPCGHTLCVSCGDALALQKAGPVCHVCRGPFEKLFRIYLQ